MRKIKVKVLGKNGEVAREFVTAAEGICIDGDNWTADDVDSALDLLREKTPVVFSLEDGTIGDYDFEIIDDNGAENNVPDKGKGNVTELIAILDMSGSMAPFTDDTIGGFNALIEEQKKDEEKVEVTLVTFNSQYREIFKQIPVREVRELTKDDYLPSGMTALLDAIGKTVTEFKAPEGAKVMVSITTDGLENASQEFRKNTIKKIIEEKQKEGWEFIFVGANMDSVSEAETIGIRRDRAANYSQAEGGTRTLFKGISKTLSSYKKDVSMDSAWEEGSKEIK